jgi:DNA-binding SARP family transcriptional activator
MTADPRASIRFRDLGTRSIEVDGALRAPKISKSYELLAYLMVHGQGTRDELLNALFEGRTDDSARAYLRQAIHALRESLPDGVLVAPQGGSVALADDALILSDSDQLESELAEAARLQGTDRIAATLAALTLAQRGEYLAGTGSAWVDEHRARLLERVVDARFEAAELAFAASNLELAEQLGRDVLDGDPDREAACRLMMRIAGARGDADGVIREFKSCERALAEIGAAPSQSTRHLLDALRL